MRIDLNKLTWDKVTILTYTAPNETIFGLFWSDHPCYSKNVRHILAISLIVHHCNGY